MGFPLTLRAFLMAVTCCGGDVAAGGAWDRCPSVRDGRTLYLAGLEWPGETGLAGHSNGDAAAHAACDALLSAAGLGDLGAPLGTSRPEWAGAPGAALLLETARLVAEAGYTIGNVAIS